MAVIAIVATITPPVGATSITVPGTVTSPVITDTAAAAVVGREERGTITKGASADIKEIQ